MQMDVISFSEIKFDIFHVQEKIFLLEFLRIKIPQLKHSIQINSKGVGLLLPVFVFPLFCPTSDNYRDT